MTDSSEEKSAKLKEFFGLDAGAELLSPEAREFKLKQEIVEGLRHFNIEWHVVPSAEASPLDDSYAARLYPSSRDFMKARENGASYREQIFRGHARHQGTIVGV